MSGSAIVVCTWSSGRGGLPGGVEEAWTVARRASTPLGAELRWLVLGALPEGGTEAAGRYGVTAIDRIDAPGLDRSRPALLLEALVGYCKQRSIKALLFPQDHDVRLVAPLLAGRLDAGVVMNALDLEVEAGQLRVTAAAYGGDTRAVYEFCGEGPALVAITPNAVQPEPAAASTPAVSQVAVDVSGADERVHVTARAQGEGPRLEDAEIIVAGGRGLGDQASFRLIEELADALGGMAGASRPLVDDGWISAARQVGLTGKITRPALYIAVGISGASQHMAGCSAAKTIVAINRDPEAPIFRYARFGIIGNCLEIMPELIRAARALRATRPA